MYHHIILSPLLTSQLSIVIHLLGHLKRSIHFYITCDHTYDDLLWRFSLTQGVIRLAQYVA